MPDWILPISLAVAMAVVLGYQPLQRRWIRRRQVRRTRMALAAWLPVSPPLGDGHPTSGAGAPAPAPDVAPHRLHVVIGGPARHRLVT